jgi:hypothetical protein
LIDGTLNGTEDFRNFLPLVKDDWFLQGCESCVGVGLQRGSLGRPIEANDVRNQVARRSGFAGGAGADDQESW